jgi:integrase
MSRKKKIPGAESTLETFSIQNVHLSIYFDTRRPKKKLSKTDPDVYPVKYRVTHLNKQAYYPCMDLTKKEWDMLIGKTKSQNCKTTRDLIYSGFDSLKATVRDVYETGGFSLDEFNTRRSMGTKDSVLGAFDAKIEGLKRIGKIGTATWYSCAVANIRTFTKDLKFSEVTTGWLENYQAHLRKEEYNEEGKITKKAAKSTTQSFYLRALRSIMNDALAKGIITRAQYPFNKFTIPTGTGRKIALTVDQLNNVFDYKIFPDDEKWRDLWVFSFYCNGANINDICRFKYGDIAGGILYWDRMKTIDTAEHNDGKIKARVNEEMQRIIDLYGNPDKSPDNYIFPFLKKGMTPKQERDKIQDVCHNINKKMKKIGKALGVGSITTYWARHSWASISRRSGTSDFVISKGMGHKNLKTTQIYLDSLSTEEVIEASNNLPKRNHHE